MERKFPFVNFWEDTEIQEAVTLVSQEGDEFLVSLEAAQISPVIATSLDIDDQGEMRVYLQTIRSELLYIVVKYLHYKTKYSRVYVTKSTASTMEAPSFQPHIPSHLVQDLTLVADYLGI